MKQKTNQQLIEGLLWILNKSGQRVRFNLNPTQSQYEKTKTKRDLILKARQKGFSSYILADQFIDCIRKPTNAVVISHEKEATKRLFAKVKYYIDNLEVKPAIQYDTKQDIVFPKRPSNYYIGTAGQKAFGRGDTIHRVHGSEVAFWQKPETIIAGFKEAVPLDGIIIFESSANGRGNWFYDEWQAAKAGESIYTPHFIPWFIDNEYQLSEKDLIKLEIKEAVRERIIKTDFTDEEKDLIKKHSLMINQIWWRRFKLWDLGEMFQQEYPENDVDCFLQSGRPVFKVIKMIERSDLQKDKQYLGGVDGAEGIESGDNHCFAIIDPGPPAKVVFEITNTKPIDIFWQEIKKIVGDYNIRLGIEKNGVGVAHIQKARDLKINFRAWNTTESSRPLLITELEESYRKEELFESYLEAKNELLDMSYNEKNKPEAPANKHDDRVFARGIAWQMRKTADPSVRFL